MKVVEMVRRWVAWLVALTVVVMDETSVVSMAATTVVAWVDLRDASKVDMMVEYSVVD